MDTKDKVKVLIDKGATIPVPESVYIGDEVSLDRIAGNGVFIYPGCRIFGETTLIMAGVKLGYEAPVTVEDCQLGPNVDLRGGFFRKATFLEGANMGSGAHVREGCLLEEQAGGAHTVGLKQTILFPFVTLGSLINFCDCLMAGGTSRKNHSEVGSSYIHFNYSANQDKATASLIGEVPKGVMLDQAPIFLGGQGGIVGPVHIGYGAVVAAGVVCRKDVSERSLVINQGPGGTRNETMPVPHHPIMYKKKKKRVTHNIRYIANLLALRQWYQEVRSRFLGKDPLAAMLHAGALDKLSGAVAERTKRLKALAQKMPESADTYRKVIKGGANKTLLRQKKELFERWPDVEAVIQQHWENKGKASMRELFLEEIDRQISQRGRDYLSVVQGLDTSWRVKGTAWLQDIVDAVNQSALEVIPAFA